MASEAQICQSCDLLEGVQSDVPTSSMDNSGPPLRLTEKSEALNLSKKSKPSTQPQTRPRIRIDGIKIKAIVQKDVERNSRVTVCRPVAEYVSKPDAVPVKMTQENPVSSSEAQNYTTTFDCLNTSSEVTLPKWHDDLKSLDFVHAAESPDRNTTPGQFPPVCAPESKPACLGGGRGRIFIGRSSHQIRFAETSCWQANDEGHGNSTMYQAIVPNTNACRSRDVLEVRSCGIRTIEPSLVVAQSTQPQIPEIAVAPSTRTYIDPYGTADLSNSDHTSLADYAGTGAWDVLDRCRLNSQSPDLIQFDDPVENDGQSILVQPQLRERTVVSRQVNEHPCDLNLTVCQKQLDDVEFVFEQAIASHCSSTKAFVNRKLQLDHSADMEEGAFDTTLLNAPQIQLDIPSPMNFAPPNFHGDSVSPSFVIGKGRGAIASSHSKPNRAPCLGDCSPYLGSVVNAEKLQHKVAVNRASVLNANKQGLQAAVDSNWRSHSMSDMVVTAKAATYTIFDASSTHDSRNSSYEQSKNGYWLKEDELTAFATTMEFHRDNPTAALFIDSHCHIDFMFSKDRHFGTWQQYKAERSKSWSPGYEACVTNFCDPRSAGGCGFGGPLEGDLWQRILEDNDDVFGSFGVHPHHAASWNDALKTVLGERFMHSKVVSAGEMGLDYGPNNDCDHDVQKRTLVEQLEIALAYKKPLVVHCRDADNDCLEILRKYVPPDTRIHRHCFTQDLATAQTWLEAFPNLYIGLTTLVYRAPRKLTEVMLKIPLNRLLIETDAPFFLPPFYKSLEHGKLWNNHPGTAMHVAMRIAEIRRIDLAEVLFVLRENAKTMYSLPV